MICVGLIAMGIVNEENHDVYRTESGGSIYTPKEDNKTITENEAVNKLVNKVNEIS